MMSGPNLKIQLKPMTYREKIANSLSWQSEAQKVIQAKLDHYEKTGNVRKADIYRRKLSSTTGLIRKLLNK